MKYKYYLFNYPEKYTNIFKKFNKVVTDLAYKEKCSIKNEFDYLVKLYSKKIEGELFYLLYIECDKVSEDFLQLIVDYYLTDYITKNEFDKNRFYNLYMIFNVKEFDNTIENYIKYGAKSGDLGRGIHGYNRLPIVFDTKNSKLYVSASNDYSKSYFNKKQYVSSMVKPILNSMEEYYQENKLSYKENTKLITSKSNIYYQDDTYPNNTIYHKYSPYFNKTKILIVFIIIFAFYFYLFFISKEFQIISNIRKISIVLVMGLFLLIMTIISLSNNSIEEGKVLSIISQIKLEPDSKLLTIIKNFINNKQNDLKNINFVLYKKDLLTNLPKNSILLVTPDIYKKNKDEIKAYISKSHLLTFIYNEETNYLQVFNARANHKLLKQILKYIK